MRRSLLFIIIILLSFNAQAYRCGNKLITTDSSMYKALSFCGEPLNRNSYDKSFCRWNRWRGISECIQIKVDVLTYKRSGATTRLIFHNQRLYNTESCRNC
jgi:hypothetical protein